PRAAGPGRSRHARARPSRPRGAALGRRAPGPRRSSSGTGRGPSATTEGQPAITSGSPWQTASHSRRATDSAELRSQTTVESGGPSGLRSAGVPNSPVPGDPTTEPDRPGEAGGVLARLAVTLFAAGFWSYRGRIYDATNRQV